MSKQKTIRVVQIASPIGRQGYQKKCLIGLGLNKINRTRVLPYNDSIFGMVKKLNT
ncbi:MAG: 50S ribosomal protein L30 [Alphaproteobacteria bacterium]|nr:MAG: 50S ribosomal protein L30 [Alphaproteobacteria bacterium]